MRTAAQAIAKLSPAQLQAMNSALFGNEPLTDEQRAARLRQSKTVAKAADIAHETKTEGRTLRPFRPNPHE